MAGLKPSYLLLEKTNKLFSMSSITQPGFMLPVFSVLFLGCLGPLEKAISLYSLSSQISYSSVAADYYTRRKLLRLQVLQESSKI